MISWDILPIRNRLLPLLVLPFFLRIDNTTSATSQDQKSTVQWCKMGQHGGSWQGPQQERWDLSFIWNRRANKKAILLFVLPEHMSQMIGEKSQVDLWLSKSTRLKLCWMELTCLTKISFGQSELWVQDSDRNLVVLQKLLDYIPIISLTDVRGWLQLLKSSVAFRNHMFSILALEESNMVYICLNN